MIPHQQLKTIAANFCKKYFVNIVDASKRVAKMFPLNYNAELFSAPVDKDVYHVGAPRYDTEPLLTIEIPLSKLEAIADIESIFYNNIDSIGHRRIFEAWQDQQRYERALREKYPAVQNAYQAYSTMLNLVREKPNDFKDLP